MSQFQTSIMPGQQPPQGFAQPSPDNVDPHAEARDSAFLQQMTAGAAPQPQWQPPPAVPYQPPANQQQFTPSWTQPGAMESSQRGVPGAPGLPQQFGQQPQVPAPGGTQYPQQYQHQQAAQPTQGPQQPVRGPDGRFAPAPAPGAQGSPQQAGAFPSMPGVHEARIALVQRGVSPHIVASLPDMEAVRMRGVFETPHGHAGAPPIGGAPAAPAAPAGLDFKAEMDDLVAEYGNESIRAPMEKLMHKLAGANGGGGDSELRGQITVLSNALVDMQLDSSRKQLAQQYPQLTDPMVGDLAWEAIKRDMQITAQSSAGMFRNVNDLAAYATRSWFSQQQMQGPSPQMQQAMTNGQVTTHQMTQTPHQMSAGDAESAVLSVLMSGGSKEQARAAGQGFAT